tara:strand:+ start:8236 stop:8649 length:414 start_codon:yes stop_codon:yes gene_type:complete
MKKAVLIRLNQDNKQSLGRFYLYNGLDEIFTCSTLELPFKENKRNISCIPTGRYLVNTRTSSKYGDHFILEDVPNRDFILIHTANYYSQLRGCIAVGEGFSDINKDDSLDVYSSKKTLQNLLKKAPEGFDLIILDSL